MAAIYRTVHATYLANCVIRNDDSDCDDWPDNCPECILVKDGLVKLPKVWDRDFDTTDQEDWYQLCMLLMKHIRGTCDGRVCGFCSIERIPL